jgi:hypothetical protein
LNSQQRNFLKNSGITVLLTLTGVTSALDQKPQSTASKPIVAEKSTSLSLGRYEEASEKWRRVLANFVKDIRLLASLFIARFIVWRSIRSGAGEALRLSSPRPQRERRQ